MVGKFVATKDSLYKVHCITNKTHGGGSTFYHPSSDIHTSTILVCTKVCEHYAPYSDKKYYNKKEISPERMSLLYKIDLDSIKYLFEDKEAAEEVLYGIEPYYYDDEA